MRILKPAAMLLAGLLASAAGASAGELITMPAAQWQMKPHWGGVEYDCVATACGKGSVVAATSQRIQSNVEEEINKPYFDIRAFANLGARYVEERGFGKWNLTSVTKRQTKEYALVNVLGEVSRGDQKAAIAMAMLIQRDRVVLIMAATGSSAVARRYLAAAIRSGDFHRPP